MHKIFKESLMRENSNFQSDKKFKGKKTRTMSPYSRKGSPPGKEKVLI